MTTHKMCFSFEYQTWKRIIQTCNNPNSKGYANVGGKGIGLSDEFKTFLGFYDSMGPMPDGCNTVIRLDQKLDFSRQNCIWANVCRGRPRGSNKEFSGKSRKVKKFKNPKILAITIEADHLNYIRKQALQASVQKGVAVECNDLVREALIKAFPMPKQYDMFGGKIK